MLAKRIIPCLDVRNGRVVKGIRFNHLRDAGDPVEQTRFYNDEGADEIVFLDITASHEKRDIIMEVVRRTADVCFTPLTVGGGIRCLEDARKLIFSGADKIALNTAAVEQPDLISDCALALGSQAVVVAVDAKREGSDWRVYGYGGRKPTAWTVKAWVEEAVRRGAGEILLTSMDRDGTRKGYDLALTQCVTAWVPVPVIASGGCGNLSHFYDVFQTAKADAALAASLFHYKIISISQTKAFLNERNIHVRLT